MAGDALQRLRAKASRGDYTSMARLARALYAEGLGSREVLRRCYGVDLPEEFFVIAEADPWALDLMVEFTNQPWRLAVPLDLGGPVAKPDSMEDSIERKIFARDPDLIPLALCVNVNAGYGGLVLCYRLGELQARRATVFGVWKDLEQHGDVRRCADSLLAALHEHHTACADWLHRELWHPSNLRRGGVSDEDVTDMRALADQIKELRRRVASRPAG